MKNFKLSASTTKSLDSKITQLSREYSQKELNTVVAEPDTFMSCDCGGGCKGGCTNQCGGCGNTCKGIFA
ncbi:hypothetical protein KAR28_06600 [Candidatus Parcubacteria bacterium]|nr:hypothetical protein [Candidatus Parcubacteria bacterium]